MSLGMQFAVRAGMHLLPSSPYELSRDIQLKPYGGYAKRKSSMPFA